MNQLHQDQFEDHVRRVVRPIVASPTRKRGMADELLTHLADAFEHERRSATDESAAFEAAMQRLGDTDELRCQLQASVPFIERIFFAILGQQEFSMTRLLLWIVVIVVLVIGINAISPKYGPFVVVSAVLLSAATVLVRVSRKDPTMLRYFRPRLLVLVGCVGVLFGTSLILPALAKFKQQGGVMPFDSGLFLTAGALLVLEAFAFIGCGVLTRRPRVA